MIIKADMFFSMLVRSIQVCANTKPGRKDILEKQLLLFIHFSSYKAIFQTTWSTSFYSEKYYSKVANTENRPYIAHTVCQAACKMK